MMPTLHFVLIVLEQVADFHGFSKKIEIDFPPIKYFHDHAFCGLLCRVQIIL
jgi:hypothetical protein